MNEKQKTIEPLFDKNKVRSEEELKHFTNIEKMNESTPIKEMEDITLKPFEKLWNGVSNKIKWVNKPKKSHQYFDYIYEELIQIYGEQMGGLVMKIHLDIMEVEFSKIIGKRIKWDEILYGGCSLNQWRKLITILDEIFSKCGSGVKLKVQKVK